jgi:hypothetical protein
MKLLLKLLYKDFLLKILVINLALILVYGASRFLTPDHSKSIVIVSLAAFLLYTGLYAVEQLYSKNIIWMGNLPLKKSDIFKSVLLKNIPSLMIYFSLFISTCLGMYYADIVVDPEKYKIPEQMSLTAYWANSVGMLISEAKFNLDQMLSYESSFYGSHSLVVLSIFVAFFVSVVMFPGANFFKILAGNKKRSTKLFDPNVAYLILSIFITWQLTIRIGDIYALAFFSSVLVMLNIETFNKFYTNSRISCVKPAVGMFVFLICFSNINTYVRLQNENISINSHIEDVSKNLLFSSYITKEHERKFFIERKIQSKDEIYSMIEILSNRDNLNYSFKSNRGLNIYNYKLKDISFREVLKRNSSHSMRLIGLFNPNDLTIDDIKFLVDDLKGRKSAAREGWKFNKKKVLRLSKYLSYRDFSKAELEDLFSSDNINSMYLGVLLNKDYVKKFAMPNSIHKLVERNYSLSSKYDFSKLLEEKRGDIPFKDYTRLSFLTAKKVSRSVASVSKKVLYPRFSNGHFYMSKKNYINIR